MVDNMSLVDDEEGSGEPANLDDLCFDDDDLNEDDLDDICDSLSKDLAGLSDPASDQL